MDDVNPWASGPSASAAEAVNWEDEDLTHSRELVSITNMRSPMNFGPPAEDEGDAKGVNRDYVVSVLAGPQSLGPELSQHATAPPTFAVPGAPGPALPLLEQQTIAMKLAEHTQHFNVGNALSLLRALEAGTVDVNLADEKGYTALHNAATVGDETSVHFLLTHGANADAQTRSGYTALMFACIYGHRIIVQMLLDAGANIHIKRRTGGGARELAAHPICGFPIIVRILDEYAGGSAYA
eukprot:Unigene844_Nuclearia_a/m.2718 Unigene844_Nuclearia_a/g.2718  ORF Unigene844_Nuclearia_a/g.2718 Unigene844_Nuclearia_a/m.2718 type:complete len:239 (+) Unigene844_Nuclearia_a:37-753(+)